MPADLSTSTHLTYADLTEGCPEECNGGHVYSPAWAAWNEREAVARAKWEKDRLGLLSAGEWYLSPESKALEEEVPDGPEEWECDTCHGTGQVPNETGRAILALVHWSKQ